MIEPVPDPLLICDQISTCTQTENLGVLDFDAIKDDSVGGGHKFGLFCVFNTQYFIESMRVN